MARKRQSNSGFNVSGFDGVDMAVDLGGAIDRWRGPSYPRWAGGSTHAAGWAVDETAKAAVLGIRAGFDKHLKRQAPWTKSATVYKRLSKSDLRGLERGERQPKATRSPISSTRTTTADVFSRRRGRD
jgi:hypothetical protein